MKKSPGWRTQIYEESGRKPGRDLDNWLQAEAQLNGAAKTTATATLNTTKPVLLRK